MKTEDIATWKQRPGYDALKKKQAEIDELRAALKERDAEIEGWRADQKENLANQVELQAQINAQRAVMQQALEFVEFVWREVSLNQYAAEKLEKTEAALKEALK